MKINKYYLLLALIIVLAAAIRFYHLPQMANWDYDQEYDANFAYSVLKVFPIQLIGQGTSVISLFVGPIYYYFLTPFMWLTQLHPLGIFIGSVTWGLISIVLYFFIFRSFWGNTAGLLAAFMRGFYYPFINADWTATPALHADVIALLTWWGFYKYFQGQTNILPFITLLFGLYLNIHPSLFPLIPVFLILLIVKRKLPSLKVCLVSVASFLAPISSLILFEFLHNFLEVKSFINIFLQGGSTTGAANHLSQFINFFQLVFLEPLNLLNIKTAQPLFILIPFYGLIISLAYKKVGFFKNSFHLIFPPLAFLVYLVYYSFFPTHVPEYYFVGLSTLTLFYLVGIITISTKLPFVLLPILLAALTLNSTYNWLDIRNHTDLVTLSHKDEIVKKIVQTKPQGQKIYISYIKNPGWNFGFDYLIRYYQLSPSPDITPYVYTIVLPKSLSAGSLDYVSGNIGLIYPDQLKTAR